MPEDGAPGPDTAVEPLKTALQAEMLENRLAKRHRHLRKWARRVGVQAYRLYDRDIPEIPLLLDLYGDAVVGALYERPYEKDEAEEESWLDAMAEATARALDLPRERVFLRLRRRQRTRAAPNGEKATGKPGFDAPLEGENGGRDQYGRVDDAGVRMTIQEGGLSFRVNLSDYLDTGLFLDHRKTRSLLREAVRGARVLNLFCYTGSFSVYAAAGGAAAVDSVDLSNTYLDWAADNFALNGYRALKVAPQELHPGRAFDSPYRLVRADVLRFISGAAAAGLTWDHIVLDPPTFSNSKKMRGSLDIKRDHRALISDCLALLNPGGRIWFSANAKGFRLDAGALEGATVEDLTEATRDEDFGRRLQRVCYRIGRV